MARGGAHGSGGPLLGFLFLSFISDIFVINGEDDFFGFCIFYIFLVFLILYLFLVFLFLNFFCVFCFYIFFWFLYIFNICGAVRRCEGAGFYLALPKMSTVGTGIYT